MSWASSASDVTDGDRITLDILEELVERAADSGTGSFVLGGSTLDYRIDDYAQILTFGSTPGGIGYEVDLEWPDEFPEDNEATERSRLKDAFLRAGISEHPNLDEVMRRLRQYDDIIMGIDTNVLLDCLLTSILVEKIYEQDYPNWILIAVPKLVMAELENGANSSISAGNHPRAGWPTYQGRVAQRALQEVMEIREKNPDRPGLAMMTVGDMQENGVDITHDNWRLDSQIRKDFQEFLNDINFHKGTYFLSQDRVMVMMSGSEGADGLYLQKPEIEAFRSDTITVSECARLIYELCIQFGDVRLESDEGGKALELDIFWPGKQVADWEASGIKVAEISW